MKEPRIAEMMQAARWWADRNIDSDDSVALLTSTTVNQHVVEGLKAAASSRGADVVKITVDAQSAPGNEPPEIVREALDGADVAVSCAAEISTHTETITDFIKSGGRHLKPNQNLDAYASGLAKVYLDERRFEEMRNSILRYTDALDEAETIRITTRSGTDVSASLSERYATPSYGIADEQHGHTSFPTGETHIPPVEGTTEGEVVVDTSMGNIGFVAEPMTLVVTDGYVEEIRGGQEASELQALLADYGRESRNFAEFGFGMNPFASVTGNKNIDKKSLGTAHVALGDNHAFKVLAGQYDMPGGVVAGVHLDAVLQDVTLYLDGEKVIEEGTLLL
jgi:leucyl aminopeptidase (aminopeptidase T)